MTHELTYRERVDVVLKEIGPFVDGIRYEYHLGIIPYASVHLIGTYEIDWEVVNKLHQSAYLLDGLKPSIDQIGRYAHVALGWHPATETFPEYKCAVSFSFLRALQDKYGLQIWQDPAWKCGVRWHIDNHEYRFYISTSELYPHYRPLTDASKILEENY